MEELGGGPNFLCKRKEIKVEPNFLSFFPWFVWEIQIFLSANTLVISPSIILIHPIHDITG